MSVSGIGRGLPYETEIVVVQHMIPKRLFSQYYALASEHITYVLCVYFIQVPGHNIRSLLRTPDFVFFCFFFEKLFMAILFYSQSFCQKSAETKSPKKYFSYFAFRCVAWDSKPGFCDFRIN